jgi:hypothetical protein
MSRRAHAGQPPEGERMGGPGGALTPLPGPDHCSTSTRPKEHRLMADSTHAVRFAQILTRRVTP